MAGIIEKQGGTMRDAKSNSGRLIYLGYFFLTFGAGGSSTFAAKALAGQGGTFWVISGFLALLAVVGLRLIPKDERRH